MNRNMIKTSFTAALFILISFTVHAAVQPPGIPDPDIMVSDSVSPIGDFQIPFGEVTAGVASNQTVTVSNTGNADLVMGTIAQANALSVPFSIQNDACSGQTIAPSGTCTFTLRFSPSATGTFSDTFDIPSNDSDENPVTFTVSGTGAAVQVSDITVTDTAAPSGDLQIPFGDVTEGTASNKTVTISNSGNADLVIGTIAQANSIAAPFSIINDACSGQNIAPSGTCTFTVRFTPSASGAFNDTFDIPSNDLDENPVTMTISGTGLQSVVNNPPSLPQLVYPANGQNNLGTSVEFRWDKSTDPDGENVTYDLYVCTDEELTMGCNTGINIAYLKSNDIYYADMGTQWAVLFLFGFILACAGFVRGRSKTSLLIIITCMVTALLISCGGGGGGGGGSGSIANTIPTGDSEINNENTYTISALSAGTTYYWKVVAKDDTGAETSSPIWTFITQ
ncbi:MAG: choice-of-anchor D domain-containing protein [Nitrospiraceae bacterium]|nr:MAG: choice-of-anchor D domain-containing protein [Nitrospiraceae bacterium]